MIQFTKKEIQGLLENLSKDPTRPALCDVYVDTENKKLVATDGYTMVVVTVDWEKEFPPIDTSEYSDYYIPTKALSDWCKLHSTRDTITSDELAKMVEPKDCRYPNYADVIDRCTHEEYANSGKFDLTLIHRFEKLFPLAKLTMHTNFMLVEYVDQHNNVLNTRVGLICARSH